MIATYDSHSGIAYIQVQSRLKIKKVMEFDVETIVELDETGDLVAVEMIKPNPLVLKRIAKKFERWELARVDLKSLQKAID